MVRRVDQHIMESTGFFFKIFFWLEFGGLFYCFGGFVVIFFYLFLEEYSWVGKEWERINEDLWKEKNIIKLYLS